MVGHELEGRTRGRVSRLVVMSMVAAAAVVGWSGPASGGVNPVPQGGSAFGASGNVTLFGALQLTLPPTPSVTLPPGGGAESASAPSAFLGGGPAVILETGPLTASTEGTTGPGGSVTSIASARDVGPGPITADRIRSTCTASAAGLTGSTRVVNGQVVVSEGDPEVEGDETTVNVPLNPSPNTEYTGTIESVGDSFRVVFNEQIVTTDSIIVNGMHLYLLGPTAVGEAIVAQSNCGAAPATPSTLTCERRTNAAGTLVDICTVSDPDGIRSVQIRNLDSGATLTGLSFNCAQAPTEAKIRVPAGSRYRVIVTDCDTPRTTTTFTLRANGSVV